MTLLQAAKFTVHVAIEEQVKRNYTPDPWFPLVLEKGQQIAALVKPNVRGCWYAEPELIRSHGCTIPLARKLQTLDFLSDANRGRRLVTLYEIEEPVPAAACRAQNNRFLGCGGAFQYYITAGYIPRLRRLGACVYASDGRFDDYHGGEFRRPRHGKG